MFGNFFLKMPLLFHACLNLIYWNIELFSTS